LLSSTVNTENEWLKKASEGDEKAFTHLFRAYYQKLGAYVFRITESSELAKDIVQDVFLKVWTNRENLATVQRFGAYIYVLARNHTYNCLRQIARERTRKIEAMQEILQPDSSEEQECEYFDLLEQAVLELPPQQRRVYLLSRRERLKYDEIARDMEISYETVKKYLKLATRFIVGYVRKHREVLSFLVFLSLQVCLTAYARL